MRQEQQGRVLFVPIDFIEPKQIRTSFKSLLKAILPAEALQQNHNNKQNLTMTISATRINSNANLPQNVNGNSSKQNRSITENYLRTVDESSWLEQVCNDEIKTFNSYFVLNIFSIYKSSILIDSCVNSALTKFMKYEYTLSLIY